MTLGASAAPGAPTSLASMPRQDTPPPFLRTLPTLSHRASTRPHLDALCRVHSAHGAEMRPWHVCASPPPKHPPTLPHFHTLTCSAGSMLLMTLSCATGTSARGNMSMSGTNVPWSYPRRASVRGDRPAAVSSWETRAASSGDGPGAGYCSGGREARQRQGTTDEREGGGRVGRV
eukprot:285841-Chlamydomonas_euryale.AAC.1